MIVKERSQLGTVQSALTSRKGPIVIDCETNWTDSYAERWLMGVSIVQEERDGSGTYDHHYIPIGHRPTILGPADNIDYVPSEFWDSLKGHRIIMHNGKGLDFHMLRDYAGFKGRFPDYYDTMLMHHYIDENSLHDLDNLSRQYCSVQKNTTLAKAIKNDWDNAWIESMAQYAIEDSIAELQLYHYLNGQFDSYRETWEKVDRDFMYLLIDMEAKGLRLDTAACRKQERLCRERMEQIKEEAGWDIGSKNLLIERLFSEVPKGYGLTPLSHTPKKGEPQVNKAFLENTNHPICGLILEYRALEKQAGYYSGYQTLAAGHGRLHPSFKMHGTVTGRLSCENPNLQQVPRESEVKKMFLPDEGDFDLWEFDFRNLELRLTAVYTRDAKLLDAFENERDIHQEVADQLGITRQTAKIVNFLLTYGGGAPALSSQAKLPYKKAKAVFDEYQSKYPDVFRYMDLAERTASNNGEVKLFSGRRRHFKYASEYRKAFNSLMQGGGFEIVKRGMLRLEKIGVDMRNQVHDSAWVNGKLSDSDVEEIKSEMSDWTKEELGLHFSVDAKVLRYGNTSLQKAS
jgi:DNA polymerase-1